MDRKPLKSSQIKSVGYDEGLRQLEIEFMSTAVYRYEKVPKEVYEALMRAESPGHYFAVDIRANYPYERVHLDGVGRAMGVMCMDTECWCHRQRKDVTNGAQVPNPSLEKDLKKSIKKAKAAKRVS